MGDPGSKPDPVLDTSTQDCSSCEHVALFNQGADGSDGAKAPLDSSISKEVQGEDGLIPALEKVLGELVDEVLIFAIDRKVV